MCDSNPGWTVVIPLKPPAVGKSRLLVPGVDRPMLARAIAMDTLNAVCSSFAVAEVVVVSYDTSWRLPPGARLVLEPRTTTLGDAIARGLATVPLGAPKAVLLGDLPGLIQDHLTCALRAAEKVDRGVVFDREETGTTLVTARQGVKLVSAFGPNSADQHRQLGLTELPICATSTLRRDVDSAEHLVAPLGPYTTSLLRASGIITENVGGRA